jgi:acylphosphatase
MNGNKPQSMNDPHGTDPATPAPSASSATERGRWRIHGFVQGVGFRAWTSHKARGIGLVGWVRNLEDGTVEAEAGGTAEQIEALESLLARGPRHANVRRIDRLPPTTDPLPDRFEVRL